MKTRRSCEIVEPPGTKIAKLFQPADFNECGALSRDSQRSTIRLDSEQLQQLRQYGKFDVKSGNFPDLIFGLPHTNHGDVDRKIHDERLRFITCELTVKSAKRKAVMDFWDTYEQIMCSRREVPKEVAEMKQPPYQFVTPARLAIDLRLHDTHILQQCLKKIDSFKNHSAIDWFSDFKRELTTSLRDQGLKMLPFNPIFSDEGKTMNEVKEVIRQDALHHHASKMFDAIRSLRDLEEIGHGLAEALIQQASFAIIVSEAKDAFVQALLRHQEKELKRMQELHGWLYHIREWRQRELHGSTREYLEAHKFDIHESVLSKCVHNGLEQKAFFVRRDLQFLKERERLLREQLVKSTSFSDSQFIFTVSAQLIRHWRVYRRENPGITTYEPVERILVKNTKQLMRPAASEMTNSPRYIRNTSAFCKKHHTGQNVIDQAARPLSLEEGLSPQDFDPLLAMHHVRQREVSPDAYEVDRNVKDIESGLSPSFHSTSQVSPMCDINQPEYVVQSCFVFKASTRHFMWRWLTFFVFTYSWFLRLEQLFLVTIPFRTAFSLTAIFQSSPIYVKVDVDQSTGHLFYDKKFYVDTLTSLLRRNWQQIKASRRVFDSAPAGGLLNKLVITRPLHRVWSYLIRGFLVSLFLLLFWPPTCLVVSIASLMVAFLLPFVLPVVIAGLHLLSLLVWDIHKPVSKKNRWFPLPEVILRRFLCGFLLQFTISMLMVIILCPVSMSLWLLWSVLRLIFRSIWDAIIFHLVIKPSARVPAREDAMIKHIHGPGTRENHFYRARPLDVLVILLAQLELLELSLWRHQMDAMANKPMLAYRRLIGSLSWLSVIPKAEGDIYNTLCTATQKCQLTVAAQFDARVQDLRLDIKQEILMRIKLSDWDLRVSVDRHVSLNGERNHMQGLSTSLLQQTFGENILTCIVETDTVFNFQTEDRQLYDKFHSFVKLLSVTETTTFSLPAPTSPASVNLARSSKLPSSSTPSTYLLPAKKETNDQVASSEQVSLTSDAMVSTSDAASQQCSVLPMELLSSRAPDITGINARMHEVVGDVDDSTSELFSLLQELQMAETGDQSDTARRFDLIHVDPPVLDVGNFVPGSFLQLPSPLKSFSQCTSMAVARYGACSPCLPSLFRRNKVSIFSFVSSNRNRSLVPPSMSENGNLNAQSSLSQPLSDYHMFGKTYQAASTSWLAPAVLPPALKTDNGRWCTLLFGESRPCQDKSSLDCFSVYQVVEWIGCVYHPVIITLLMHGRDREHRPLDLSHPALGCMVNAAIYHRPKATDHCRLRSKPGYRREPWLEPRCRRDHLVKSMASGLAGSRQPIETRMNRAYSIAVPAYGGELSTSHLFSSALPANLIRSLNTVKCQNGESSHQLLFQTTSDKDSIDVRQSLFAVSSCLQPASSLTETALCEDQQRRTSCQDASQPQVEEWKRNSAYWNTGESQQLDCSTTTPTLSLYGTDDDDVSTGEVEETDYDALSISSVNQPGFFIDSHLLPALCKDTTDAPVAECPPANSSPRCFPPDLLASTSHYTQPQLTVSQSTEDHRRMQPEVTMEAHVEPKEGDQLSTPEEESARTTISSRASVRPSPSRQDEVFPPNL